MRALLLLIFVCVLLPGCTSIPASTKDDGGDPGRAGSPDIHVRIDGLGPCNGAADRTLHLDSRQPLNILVHGCRGSAGRFRALAEVLAFHGQQSACFTYDDRDALMVSSGQLVSAVEQLAEHMPQARITLLGHSMGGLVARKSLVADRADPVRNPDVGVRLVTISAPFAGIEAANPCANPLLRVLTLGFNDLACWLISGDKWFDITSASDFIRQPGALAPQVDDYLQIVTDERESCRTFDGRGRCIEDDYIFSLAEQRHPLIDAQSDMVSVEVRAGHVEIVGESGVTPHKLIKVLQDQGVVHPTEPVRQAEFEALLARLYRE